jgi:hypothetical protein
VRQEKGFRRPEPDRPVRFVVHRGDDDSGCDPSESFTVPVAADG